MAEHAITAESLEILEQVSVGDRVIFTRPGVAEYGGTVWRSAAGGLLAGDTALTSSGSWLPFPSGDVTVTIVWNPVRKD